MEDLSQLQQIHILFDQKQTHVEYISNFNDLFQHTCTKPLVFYLNDTLWIVWLWFKSVNECYDESNIKSSRKRSFQKAKLGKITEIKHVGT